MTTPLAGLVEEEERLAGGAKGLAALRLLLASLAIAVTLALAAVQGAEIAAKVFGFHPVYTLAVVACAVDVIYLLFLRKARAARRLAGLVAAGLTLDILMGAALVHLTGGYASPFLPLLFAWVIAAGAVLSGRAALGAASLAVVCLSATLVLRDFERPAGLMRAGAFHLAQSGALFVVAYLAGQLSRRMAAARLLADDVLASLHEGLVVLDSRGRISFANRVAARLLRTELPGGQYLAQALSAAHLAPVRALLESRERFGPERAEIAGAGGARVTLAVSGTAARDARGTVRGTIALISDRSAERALEQATRLAEQRRTVSELAMSIAHEIRNPLAAIRSAAQEVGRERNISSSGRELAGVVIAESDRLDRIVTDFLTFARPRPPVFAPVALRELAAEALELVGRSLPAAKRIELANLILAGTACPADADQLRQAVLNLALNSAAAIDGAGTIRVSARRAPLGDFVAGMSPARRARAGAERRGGAADARPGLVLEVADDGAGMDAATLARAGEPFFTTRPEGTGLGLAIAERVAAAHGGALDIASTPGRGTVVRLWLSAAREENR